jgi:rhodanese-related sulfurtransferase
MSKDDSVNEDDEVKIDDKPPWEYLEEEQDSPIGRVKKDTIISASELADKIKQDSLNNLNSILIIDVRHTDADYVGGHIPNSINIPRDKFISQIPYIINNYYKKKSIVFHCMYSQVRGPICLDYYEEAIDYIINYNNNNKKDSNDNNKNELQTILKQVKINDEMIKHLKEQKILLLYQGFHAWLNLYYNNKEMISEFDASCWEKEEVHGEIKWYHVDDW